MEEFNRLHGSEGQVRVVEWRGDGFVAEFVGSFCVTCGFYDYFEDFALMVAERGVRVGVVDVEEFEGGARVAYRFLREGEELRFVPERVVLILE
ncbi:hypothetical protein Tpen_1213 [Thermofilum pendens Hrk 5]|uniref:Uncharacterized protein n=1 Tax=Thermofilum pendens (strain DSM 2475 / Hrk 5) TaxID=368408 RepID=A1RZI1_THEPD|nr:hypothetical protein Tpen_1213 [Thermofilum pendens Hrk 5]